MAKSDIRVLEQHLQERKQALMQRIASVEKDVTSSHSADWSEQAQERQNDEVIQAIGNESRNELKLINRALERIANDEYTSCSNCGNDIPLARLEAVPYTDLCITCADAKT